MIASLPFGDCGSAPQIISAAPIGEPECVVVGCIREPTVREGWFSEEKLRCNVDSTACLRCSCCNCCCCYTTN